MEVVDKIKFHPTTNMLTIEIDNDFNIAKRYTKSINKWIRKSLLNTLIFHENVDVTYSMVLNTNKSYIKVLFYCNDGVEKHICLVSNIKKCCCSKESLDLLKDIATEKIVTHFETYKNEVTGQYFVSIPVIKRSWIIMENECCCCMENNTIMPKEGFFYCNHKDLCRRCYSHMSVKKCPLCRSV